MQEDWLKTASQRKYYYLITVGIGGCAGAIASFLGTLIILITGWGNWVLTAPPFIILGGIVGALLLTAKVKSKIVPVEKLVWKLKWSWKSAGKGVVSGILLGVFACIGLIILALFINNNLIETPFETNQIIIGTIIFAFLLSAMASLILGFIGAFTGQVSYKWILIGLSLGITGGIFTTIFMGIIGFYVFRYFDAESMDATQNSWFTVFAYASLIRGFIKGLVFGLIGGIVGSIVLGLQGSEIESKVRKNQGIYYSTINALVVWLIMLFCIGIIGGAITIPASSTIFFSGLETLDFAEAFGYGTLFGLVVAMQFGGYAIIKHYALRVTIENDKTMPTGIIKSLENAVKLNLLYEVGGGFMFTHRLIMEHFAKLEAREQSSTIMKI